MILAVDVGGTKTVLSLFEAAPGGVLRQHTEDVFASQKHASLTGILERFRRDHSEAKIGSA